VRPRPPRAPELLVVEVEVDPELFDWRGASAEPVLLPIGAATATEVRAAVSKREKCMMLI